MSGEARVLADTDGRPNATSAPSWLPVDVAAVLRGPSQRLQPTILMRDDGRCLLYPGRTQTIVGESESLKTWAALIAVAQELQAGNVVVYIDLEDDEQVIVRRRLHDELRIPADHLIAQLRYVRPSEPVGSGALTTLLVNPIPTLVVIDGLTELMALHGLNPDKGSDIAAIYSRVARPFTEHGCAVLIVDHVVKDREGRGRYATGSAHKLNIVSGAAYVMELGAAPSRGSAGFSRISVVKDRVGEVRPNAVGKQIATLHVASNSDGCVSWRLETPSTADRDEAFRPTHLMREASRLLAAAEGPVSQARACNGVKGKREWVCLALTRLVEEGYARCTDGPRGALLYEHLENFADVE